ncbi:transposase [Cellulomonas bogoriensis]
MDADGGSAVSQAGGVLLTSTVWAAGLDVALNQALAPWHLQQAHHDPAKVLVDLAMTLALVGDARSDLAVVRAEPAGFGPVTCDPTLSRAIARLAGDVEGAASDGLALDDGEPDLDEVHPRARTQRPTLRRHRPPR